VLKDRNDISREVYWVMYKKIKGGQVRSSTHLRELAKQARSHSSTT
jgi:ribosomal protein L19E